MLVVNGELESGPNRFADSISRRASTALAAATPLKSSVGKNSSGVLGQSGIFAISVETSGAAEVGVSHNLSRTCPEPNSLFSQRIIFLQDFAMRHLGELGKITEACFSYLLDGGTNAKIYAKIVQSSNFRCDSLVADGEFPASGR
jgi:hypothetical protein